MSRSALPAATLATGLNAVATIVPQVVSLLTLTAAAYGQFSMVYLVFAAGSSTVFSVISDAWSRTWLGRRVLVGWRHYSGALLWLSAGFGALGLLVGLLVGVDWSAPLGAIAVATLVYRIGARYYESHVGDWRRVIAGDAANVIVSLIVVVVGLAADVDRLLLTFLVWTAGSVAANVPSLRPAAGGPRVLRRWVTVHRGAIKPLLSDSLLMDAGSIGTPYVLAPVLGLAPFGVYRAVANVGIPVQLTLNPLRPLVARMPAASLLSARIMVPLTALLLIAGAACYAILIYLPLLPFRLGVLSDLYQVALPASLFVPANGLSFFVYLVARSHAPADRILPARIAQTVLAVACPIGGALGWGLVGAVWGFSGSALLFTLIWWFALRAGRPPREHA